MLSDQLSRKAATDAVLAERNHYRNAKAQKLHERLMAKIPREVHRRLLA